MKESMGSMNVFRIVIIITFLFAGFLTLAILYNRAFQMKNEVINILEKYEGYTVSGSKPSAYIINNYLISNNYSATGNCNSDELGVYSLDGVGNYDEQASSNKEYYYCLKSIKKDQEVFYEVKLFFKFNLPIINDLGRFPVTGETKSIKYIKGVQILTGGVL